MSTLLEYQLRIRNATDTADAIVITSIRGGTNPYISKIPVGDGSSIDPLTMESVIGEYSGQIADWPIGSMQRVMTSQLEDTSGRQQLGYRKAFWERRTTVAGVTSSFDTLVAGVLTRLQLISGAEWDVAVTDPQRAGIVQQLFSPASTINITDFLASWPNRGCILGGPVMMPVVGGKPGSILGIQDRLGWTMRVESTSLAGQYFLRPVNVYGPANNWQSTNSISEDLGAAINQAANQFQSAYNNGGQSPWTTIKDTQTNYWAWPGVVVLIDGVPWKPLPYANAHADQPPSLVSGNRHPEGTGLHVISDGTRTLTNGAIVRVRVLTILPTDTCPIYLSDNPIEILKTAWTATNIAFDSSACTTLKGDSSIGNTARAVLRITSPQGLTDLSGNIQRPYGIGLRADKTGRLVPFQAREMPNTPPTRTITTANVVQGSTRLPFELDPAKAVQTVQFGQKWFADAVGDMPGGNPVDRIRESDLALTLVNGDTSAIPYGSVDLTTEAMLSPASAQNPVFSDFAQAKAQAIFNRFGHGAIALETTLIRGTAVGGGATTDDVLLGDELLINLPELPNANYRLGDNPAIAARAMQIVQLTEVAEGYAVRFVDSGPNAQPLTTVPTLSVAASSDSPRTVAQITITNAATLNALGYGARLQWAVTTGAAPSANDYTDVTAWAPGQIPTGTIRLSPVIAGSTVYVQARSEGASGARASNYGTTAHLTLSAISDPTSVTATPNVGDASLCTIGWSIGSGATGDFSDVYLRLSGQTFDQARRIGTVDPGSTRFVLEMLTASTNYIASVQHRDPRTQDVSNPVDVAFTSGSTLRALFAPFNPFGFAGSQDAAGVPQKDGVYGLAVVAGEFPGFVEFAVATETAVASGTYGAFVTMTTIPSVAGNWTIASFLAPQDGLRRQIKARQVGDGLTSSSYTTAVTVTPWTPIGLPAFAAVAQGTVTVDADGLWVAIADGPGATQSWLYATSTSAPPTDATVLASGSLVSGRTFTLNAVTALAFGGRIYITAIPMSGPNGTGVPIAPSMHLVGAYLTYQSTTTVLLAASAFKPSADLNVSSHAYSYDLNSGGALRNKGTAGDSYDFSCGYQIPQGCTISVFGEHAYSNPARGAGHTATVALTLFQVNSDGTTTGLAVVGATAVGWQDAQTSISQTTTSTTFMLQLSTSYVDASSDGLFAWAYLTYTKPTPDKTL